MGRYRTGRKNGHTIYWQDGDEPSDDDAFIGSCVTRGNARGLVDAANIGAEAGDDQPRVPPADRVRVTIRATYTEWVDPDHFDDPSLDAIRESTLNMAPEIVCNALCSTRYGGEFEITGVDVEDTE